MSFIKEQIEHYKKAIKQLQSQCRHYDAHQKRYLQMANMRWDNPMMANPTVKIRMHCKECGKRWTIKQ